MNYDKNSFLAGIAVGRRLRGALRGGEAWFTGGGGGGAQDTYSGILELPGSVMADPSALTVSGLLALPGAVIEDEQ